jgi:hypothetical protein
VDQDILVIIEEAVEEEAVMVQEIHQEADQDRKSILYQIFD